MPNTRVASLFAVGPPRPAQMLGLVIVTVAVLWTVSSWCYYALVNGWSFESGYDDAPILFTGFYLVWSAVALALFRPLFSMHVTLRRIMGHIVALLPILLIYGAFVTLVLPLLPDVSEVRAPPNPPEFMFASAWYYLPKSADILFQQTLVAAMVLSAHRAGFRLRLISIGMAVMFGGFHLMLIFDGFTSLYVARFTIAAAIFGLVIPYLYLRTRYGFRWAYGLHWSFYAVDAAVTHVVLAVPPWMN
ncbi:hypothetical protein DSM110093_02599 [Sulfitobacter sp. DSM 110093]|uniref:hypothetical protein n=1 Tax=Sulfitobacter sp. DSM 110093 TaxID=2883127 RepID=UPI001FAB5F28|nr:hypothetical protein [Sulfitobacter sp. DSM 110093]UOA32795.1 hypothetical protein DSM110093_02599 [Sulfitobacter sp. DSM 110093]